MARIKILATITGTLAAIATFVGAWHAAGLPEVAFKEYVDAKFGEVQRASQADHRLLLDIEIDQLEGQRQAIDGEINALQLRQKSTPDIDAVNRLHQLQRQLVIMDAKIEEMRKARATSP
jgi:dephospho-CoA kinase